MTTQQLEPVDLKETGKFVTESIKLIREWGPPALTALRRRFKPRGDPAVQTLATALEEVLREGHCCFLPSGKGSFIHVTSNSGLTTPNWLDVNDKLAQSCDWYDCIMTGPRVVPVTLEGLIQRLDQVNRLLFWSSRAGKELGILVRALPVDHVNHDVYARLADHYNQFVTKYETLLARVDGGQVVTFYRLSC